MPTVNCEEVVFEGRTYRRYPDHPERGTRVYFRSPGWEGRPRYLHRDIYAATHGQIPEGYDVHHKDGNPLNNDISNLEAIPEGDHYRLHAAELNNDPEFVAWRRAHFDRIRPLAAEWHRSEEGREWHREHGRLAYAGREFYERTCDRCGKTYKTRHLGRNRFCSNSCKAAWRAASGVDQVDRPCEFCGQTFRIYKYFYTKTCSRECATRLASRKRRARLQSDGG